MRKLSAILLAFLVWFALIGQFFIMLQNRSVSTSETIIRFFGYFTILTNILVALFFTALSFDAVITRKPGTLTAITVYIFIVGLVYQVLLRHLWQPSGFQFVIDELLHTVIPLLTILFWYRYENKTAVKYDQIKSWQIYPLAYLIYILVRGSFFGFYPYPFIDVSKIGLSKVLLNAGFLFMFFLLMSFLLIGAGKRIAGNGVESEYRNY